MLKLFKYVTFVLVAALCGCAVAGDGFSSAFDTQTARTASSPSSGYASLYSFTGGAHGQGPSNTLAALDGALYGVSSIGGTCCGLVFRITTSGVNQPIYDFTYGADGIYPESSLVAYKGVLYGTTLEGGEYNVGTVFALTKSGKEHVIYSFRVYNDGNLPNANLVAADGKLYGITESYQRHTVKGFSLGCVFSVTLAGKERILHIFGGAPNDGSTPTGLTLAQGKLYGTTSGGGTNDDGTVFSLSTTHDDERVLHSFKGAPKDGQSPAAPPTLWNGALYGTTSSGGADGSSSRDGTIYEISPAGKEKILHTFGGADGADPTASLIVSGSVAYGTTQEGGAANSGTIYEVNPAGREQVVYNFSTTPYDGVNPAAGLTAMGKVFYGVTTYGGFFRLGNFFRMTP